LRSLTKIVSVIDHELSGIGCSKLSLPLLTPAELWERTGRLATAGPGVFRVSDRKNADFILAPTHEEAITSLAASLLNAGMPAPLRLYQIGPKFRDEARPRAGLLRAREFIMKDLYTFDVSRENALATYESVAGAYRRIFQRLGINAIQVRSH
jgi:prolyl-tRNA synthetase